MPGCLFHGFPGARWEAVEERSEIFHFSIPRKTARGGYGARRGVGTPPAPLGTCPPLQWELLETCPEAQEQILLLQGAVDSGIFRDGWITSGTGACLNTPGRFSECGEGKAGSVSHTPHTHTLPDIPFSHPQTNPSPTGTLSRHRDLIPKSSPSPSHGHTLPPSSARLLAQVPLLSRFISLDPSKQRFGRS